MSWRGAATTSWPGVALIGAVLVVLVALVPLVLAVDDRADRQRAMYQDRYEMALLQYKQADVHGEPEALVLGPEESVELAGSSYTTAPGVSVVVETSEDGYCVQASNSHGDVAEWRCWADDEDPEKSPGAARP